ncbi:hypothetical protein FRB91_001970 [Serendipita sp. 411]|nr:hypothetical protein FRB91_001970 [Serendipita sp. 411]
MASGTSGIPPHAHATHIQLLNDNGSRAMVSLGGEDTELERLLVVSWIMDQQKGEVAVWAVRD